MSEWKEYKLKDFCIKIGSGATPTGGQESYIQSGISLIRSQNVLDFQFSKNGLAFIDEEQARALNNVSVEERDVLLNITGDSVARVCQVENQFLPARVNQHVAIIRPDRKKLNPEFLKYYLLSKPVKSYLLSISLVGGTRNALTKAMIEELEIVIPEITTQQSIAAILSSLDNKIDLLRCQNQTLEQLAQTIFKQWFVQFQYPGANGKMQQTELGEVPEGWRVGKLEDELTILMGQSPDGESYNENGEGTIFFQGRTDFEFRFPSIRLYTTEPKRMAEPFDTLVSVRAPVGDINMAFEECCIGRGLAAVKSKFKSYAFYKMQYYKPKFAVFEMEGTVFGSLGKDGFNELESIIPTDKIKSAFEELVQPIDKQIYNLSKEIQTLTQLRDSLLPRLMSGRLRVG